MSATSVGLLSGCGVSSRWRMRLTKRLESPMHTLVTAIVSGPPMRPTSPDAVEGPTTRAVCWLA